MVKILVATLTIAGAVMLTAPIAANAASQTNAIANATQTDLSAARRHTRRVVRRYYRSPRVYRAPAYYGYYGPTYYDRPYYRPAPLGFGIGGWW